jgi:hypothetical protein
VVAVVTVANRIVDMVIVSSSNRHTIRSNLPEVMEVVSKEAVVVAEVVTVNPPHITAMKMKSIHKLSLLLRKTIKVDSVPTHLSSQRVWICSSAPTVVEISMRRPTISTCASATRSSNRRGRHSTVNNIVLSLTNTSNCSCNKREEAMTQDRPKLLKNNSKCLHEEVKKCLLEEAEVVFPSGSNSLSSSEQPCAPQTVEAAEVAAEREDTAAVEVEVATKHLLRSTTIGFNVHTVAASSPSKPHRDTCLIVSNLRRKR